MKIYYMESNIFLYVQYFSIFVDYSYFFTPNLQNKRPVEQKLVLFIIVHEKVEK